MSTRELPDFLLRGDAGPESVIPSAPGADARMRAKMGLPRREARPAEGTAAAEWLRHVEAGRIG
jgi:hypothetical protein